MAMLNNQRVDDISHKTIGSVFSLLWRYVFFGGMLDVGLLGLISWGYPIHPTGLSFIGTMYYPKDNPGGY